MWQHCNPLQGQYRARTGISLFSLQGWVCSASHKCVKINFKFWIAYQSEGGFWKVFYAPVWREKVTFKLEVFLTSVWLGLHFFIVVLKLVLAKNPHIYILTYCGLIMWSHLTFKSAKVKNHLNLFFTLKNVFCGFKECQLKNGNILIVCSNRECNCQVNQPRIDDFS